MKLNFPLEATKQNFSKLLQHYALDSYVNILWEYSLCRPVYIKFKKHKDLSINGGVSRGKGVPNWKFSI